MVSLSSAIGGHDGCRQCVHNPNVFSLSRGIAGVRGLLWRWWMCRASTRGAQLTGSISARHEQQIEWLWQSEPPAGHTSAALVEVHRTPDDPAEHKKTAHYQTWRDTVAEMMAEPRSSVKYANVFPQEEGWG